MEWEKPRVSIAAARVRPGEYIDARGLSGLSSTGSIPIRAPLTIDDDDQEHEDDGSDFESNGRNSASSDSSSYSSGIDSGTDEGFESASVEPDDETAEENAVSGGIRVYWPFGEDLSGETGEGSAFPGRIRVYRSSVGDQGEETSVNYSSFGEEESGSVSEVDGITMKAKIVVPRARLSLDDDEVDQILGSEDEDNGFSGVLKGPSTGTMARVKCPGIAGGEEEVEDKSLEVRECGLIDKPEFSGSVSGESVSGEEEMMGINYLDTGSVSFKAVEEKSIGATPGDCGELRVESGELFVKAVMEPENTFEQLIEQRAVQGNIFKETVHITVSDAHESDALMVPDEGSVGLGSGELGDEDIVNMIGEAKDFRGNDFNIGDLGKLECKTEPESGTQNSKASILNPTRGSSRRGDDEIVGGVDGFLSDSGSTESLVQGTSSDPKVKSESESGAKQDLKGINRNLVLPDEDSSGSNFRNLADLADETVEKDNQISQRINNQFGSDSDLEESHVSVKAEESSLLSDKDEIIASGSATVITDEKSENEEQMARLIHNHAFMEFYEYEATSGRKEELSDSTSWCSSDESFCEHFMGHLSEEQQERMEKAWHIRAKLLRLIGRLGLPADDSIASGALAKLALASGKNKINHGFCLESDKMKMMHTEGEAPDYSDLSVNVLVLGKTGVGKSATVNSIFGETKSAVGAFGLTTSFTTEIVGNVGGVKIRILDTPGLRSSATEERINRKVLLSIKKRMRKFPIDIVLYIDRLDEHSGNIGDIQLLRTITGSLGSSIWENAIVVLTHAASIVLDSSYKHFVARRSFLLQQSIRQAVRESTFADPSVMPRIILAENNEKSFPKNEARECMSLNWRQQLLFLCCSAKIMSEAGCLQEQENLMEKSNLFSSSPHSFSLFYSLWNLLLYRTHPRVVSRSRNKLEPNIAYFSDSRAAKLSDEQKEADFEEHRFLMKKQREDKTSRFSEAKKIPRNGANGMGFKERRTFDHVYDRLSTERRNLGFQAKARGKELGVCFDAFDLNTGISVGGGSRTLFSVGSDCERDGQLLLRIRGSQQMQIAAFGVLPLVISLFRLLCGGNTEKFSK